MIIKDNKEEIYIPLLILYELSIFSVNIIMFYFIKNFKTIYKIEDKTLSEI